MQKLTLEEKKRQARDYSLNFLGLSFVFENYVLKQIRQ